MGESKFFVRNPQPAEQTRVVYLGDVLPAAVARDSARARALTRSHDEAANATGRAMLDPWLAVHGADSEVAR
ncbi:MAG: hypothetical protein MUF54_22400 [Polyangiaceae bacterium]|jgi:hypothetical protein|nr:hypothetical protein [Polyangiaceae bacterium]